MNQNNRPRMQGQQPTAYLFDEIAAGRLGEEAKESLSQAVRHVIDTVLKSGIALQILPLPLPEDPRERALQLRKQRNAGPHQKGFLDGRRRR